MILSKCGDENIVKAIVIVIADGHAHSVELDGEACLRGDVGERAVVIIVIERGMRDVAMMLGPIRAVHEKKILPTVVVVIDERHAGAHRFRQIFLAERAIIVREMNL